ncbi:DUF2852 domain-containing protein [Rhizobium sp. C4]|uniref:DUF2852 domain-containing protein n=1 Tax=Rhizobium sp. C4 TaxID=1349800 RepID=UPI001E460371|nr:DUF2852 domain-containing protein [Rhizobium sp. C4]MCD2175670.1 DUF2852 domain-containing protein [Rhizobium sp. C4]
MSIATKLDEMGRPAWIVAMIAGFIIFWPIGLAILAFTIWSGRMGCRSYAYAGYRDERRAWKEAWRDRKREMREMFRSERNRFGGAMSATGNSAFDDYKAETLRRLEQEQAEFGEFLDNLRRSRDKAEFEQFMQSRRNATAPATTETNGSNNAPSDIEPWRGPSENNTPNY